MPRYAIFGNRSHLYTCLRIDDPHGPVAFIGDEQQSASRGRAIRRAVNRRSARTHPYSQAKQEYHWHPGYFCNFSHNGGILSINIPDARASLSELALFAHV
jgi:hypothetical protein